MAKAVKLAECLKVSIEIEGKRAVRFEKGQSVHASSILLKAIRDWFSDILR